MKAKILSSLYGTSCREVISVNYRLLQFLSLFIRCPMSVFNDTFRNLKASTWLAGGCASFMLIFAHAMRDFHKHPKICCIYFLFLHGKLIYIGKTVDLRSRMFSHGLKYLHDSMRYICCLPEKLDEYEKRLIKILKPITNNHYNKRNPNRAKVPYKAPKWAIYYDRLLSVENHLKSGDHVGLARVRTYQMEKKFKYYYRTYGYKGTILDTTIPL